MELLLLYLKRNLNPKPLFLDPLFFLKRVGEFGGEFAEVWGELPPLKVEGAKAPKNLSTWKIPK